ncbi:MAG: hypothetical protein LBQ38_12890 [Spirochaetaceae bacterium]|jgi:hypothetical protein|nr:hypothetical protein [Spirochaetaceae bacterium]
MVQKKNRQPPSGIELLRKKINNDQYMNEAIQRIALVLSNEIPELTQGGTYNERKRRK